MPLDCIIGGPKMAGQGWRMLVEQLSVGRCISLPSNATGGAKAGVFATGAYARIRRQFNMPVGKFEGVEAVHRAHGRATPTPWTPRARSPPARSTAARSPSVPSAMLKYHVTEMGRQVANDAMDVHGGKGILLGPAQLPRPRLPGRCPIAITVEGANILTRSLIIFGQGAIRCHPFVLQGDERGAQSGPQAGRRRVRPRAVRPHRLHDLQRGALVRHGAHPRALHARAGRRRRPRATTSTSCASAPRSPSPSTSRC